MHRLKATVVPKSREGCTFQPEIAPINREAVPTCISQAHFHPVDRA